MKIALQMNDKSTLTLKRSLLVFCVVVFFCNIGIYLSLEVSPQLEPQYWLGLLMVLAVGASFLFRQYSFEIFRTPLFFWCVVFLGLTAILYAVVPTSYFQQVKERIRDVLLLVTLTSIFLMLRDQLGFLRKALLFAVLMGVLINMISIVHSNFLLRNLYEYAARPAGLYINPNESATALIVGMILSITILPMRWRIIYAAIVFVGVLATFSREAVFGWFIVTTIFCFFGVIGWKKLSLWTTAFVGASLSIALLLAKYKVINFYVADYYHQNLKRLVWFVSGSRHDPSLDSRLDLVKQSWNLFLKHPWIGNGIGSTEHWGLHYSTHNMYLYFMDDYGVVGLFLYPSLVWCIFRDSEGEVRKIAWCMAIFLLFWGMFDHNVTRNYYSLFAMSLMAVMSRVSSSKSGVGEMPALETAQK